MARKPREWPEPGWHPIEPATTPPIPRDSLAMRGDLKCPKRGYFRVVGVDTFEGPLADYLIADCADKDDAIRLAQAHGKPLNPTYVYSDAGELVFSAGRP